MELQLYFFKKNKMLMKIFQKYCRNFGIDFLKRPKMDIFRVAFLNFWNLGVLWTFLGAREARPRKIDTN